MNKKIIQTNNAPEAIGPYSQGVISNGFLFTAGQIPLNPNTMQLVEGGIEDQATQVLENLKAILQSENLNFSHVVKTTIYLKDLNDFQAVNTAYSKYFTKPYPARSTLQVAKLPLDARVEIEVIATLQ